VEIRPVITQIAQELNILFSFDFEPMNEIEFNSQMWNLHPMEGVRRRLLFNATND
jgi:hypothetical protein